MRIICDHCSHPVSGTVKKVAGNLNLHPECLGRLANEANQQATAITGPSQESQTGELPQFEATNPTFRAELGNS